ncbi:MAG: SDR family NAD(P)-dependent oxidoreductase [Mariprofundaceae bacterium]|nr:SDR family NAD(P)-dependent oxidoreductase [Mariprofundaceae bacterium]
MTSKDKGSVLITGASGGFGLYFAKNLEKQGYRLILHGRDSARLKLVQDVLIYPEKHRVLMYELSARKGIDQLLECLIHEEIVGLVNNAGFGVWGGFEISESVAQLDVLRVNLLAPMTLSHALLPKLKKNNGFIINVSSLAGEMPMPYMSTYGSAKAGMTFWSEALRMELQGNIKVVTLAPGPSPTGFRHVSGAPKGKGSWFSTPPEEVIEAALDCLSKGGGYCVPGWRHQLLWGMQKITPRCVALPLLKYYLKP